MLSRGSGDRRPSPRRTIPDALWAGYLLNTGVHTGHRALCDRRGTVLADFRTTVTVTRFRSSPSPSDEFLVWRTAVTTGGGVDAVEEEWARDEVAALGAAGADGSFSLGPPAMNGEDFTLQICVVEGARRVRSVHAYDWEGTLCGVVASRERRQDDGGGDGDEVQPAAWRSPNVLLDYLSGEWRGRGVVFDRASGDMWPVASRLVLQVGAGGDVVQISGLRFSEGDEEAQPGEDERVTRSRGRVDGNVVNFVESGVQLILLPGGMSTAAPVTARRGLPFVVETAFLARPDFRKRVVRCYNGDGEWINTVFLKERRVG